MTNLHVLNTQWRQAQTTEREARDQITAAIREARQTMTLAQIAEILGLSRQRVEQLSRD